MRPAVSAAPVLGATSSSHVPLRRVVMRASSGDGASSSVVPLRA